MDLVTGIIGAIFIAICLMPFVLMGNTSKRKEKQLLQSLTDMAREHNINLSQQDFCKDMAIGLCENGNALLFFKQGKDKVTSEYIDLSGVKSCKVLHLKKTITDEEGPQKVTSSLELSFDFLRKSKPDLILDFYKADENFQLSGELKLIEKWVKIINSKIRQPIAVH